MRVPMIVRWPGHIPARTVDEPAAMIDWMPTFAHLAGASLPEDLEIDGTDIEPLLTGSGLRDPDGVFRFLYYRQDNSGLAGYREGNLKLKLAVEGGESVYSRYDHPDLLFDLEADPDEQTDLSAAMPVKREELRQAMQAQAARIPPATTSD